MTQDCTKSKHLLSLQFAVEATIEPSGFSSCVSTNSEYFIVRRAAVKEAKCYVLIRHRGRELSKHYSDFGVRSSCYLSNGYALVSGSMARKSTFRVCARLVTSCVEVYDSAKTISILLSL